MTLRRTLKQLSNKKYSGWQFNGDGLFPDERVKGKYKKKRNRHERALNKELTKHDIQTHLPS